MGGYENYIDADPFGFGAKVPGTLTLLKADDSSTIVHLKNFLSGDFGITLGPNTSPRQYTDKQGTADPDNTHLSTDIPHQPSLAPNQKVHGLAGADFITVSHANAQGYGGADNDYTRGASLGRRCGMRRSGLWMRRETSTCGLVRAPQWLGDRLEKRYWSGFADDRRAIE